MKQLLIDHTSFKIAKLTLNESKSSSGRMVLEGKLQAADIKNGNNPYAQVLDTTDKNWHIPSLDKDGNTSWKQIG